MLQGHGRYIISSNRQQVISAPNPNHRPFSVTSNTSGSFQGPSVGTAFGSNYTSGVLEKIFGRRVDEKIIRSICRDAYFYDPVMGGCADLMCDLPFSDFSLGGLSSKEQTETYLKSLEKMRIKSLLPVIALDYLVDGAFLGVLSFDDQEKIFTSMIPQDLDNANLTFSPRFGDTPLVDIEIPDETRKFLTSNDKRAQALIQEMPDWFTQSLGKAKKFELLPEVTVYIPRRTMSSRPEGISYFTRCLPLFIMEKALLHGTLEQAYRRQRAILHITAGEEDWEPTDEELVNIGNLFQKADMDPIGSIVTTRQGIQPSEILSGGQFWRYDESYNQFSEIKMRALGISDQVLSGDATWSTLEQSLSIFIQSLKAFRDIIVRRLFYEKIFPYIAHQNGYLRENRTLETTGSRIIEQNIGTNENPQFVYSANVQNEPVEALAAFNPDDYHIPVIEWHNKLRPEADENYLNMMGTLAEKGVPIPMRIYASAAGLGLDEILGALDQDVSDAQKIHEYKSKISEFKKGGEEDEGGAFASLQSPVSAKKIGVLGREYPQLDNLSPKGKIVAQEEIHRNASKVLAKIAEKENAKIRKQQENQSEIYGKL